MKKTLRYLIATLVLLVVYAAGSYAGSGYSNRSGATIAQGGIPFGSKSDSPYNVTLAYSAPATGTFSYTSVTVGAQTGTLTQGTAGTATYTISVSYTAPSTGSYGLQLRAVNWTAPTGADTNFSGTPTGWIFTGTGRTYYGFLPNTTGPLTGVTLSITTTSATPAGSYTFNVSATGSYNGAGVSELSSAQVTLVIGGGCTNPTSGGTIAQAQGICKNATPAGLTSSTLPGGHNGTLEYQWQYSTVSSSSGFFDIGSATDTYYSPGALSQTTWFRRLSKVTCNGTWPSAGSSNVVQITVYDDFSSGGIQTAGQTICYNTDASVIGSASAASGGNGVYTYQWQSRAAIFDAVTWIDISGASVSTYDPPTGLTSTTVYRRLAKDGTCNTSWDASSGMWTVTVRPQFTAGGIPVTGETICYNGNPALITATTAASGGDNVISYQWQSRGADFDVGGYTDITGATNANYDPPSELLTTTTYRRLAKDGTCNTAWSASTGTWTVAVRPQFTAGAIPSTGETVCYNGNPSLITSTTAASGGDNNISYQWSTAGSSITGATNVNYDPPAGHVTTLTYTRKAKDGTCNTNWSTASGAWVVTVRSQFTAGDIPTTGETICYNGNPAQITATTAASGGDNVISYQWQSQGAAFDGSVGYTDITGATDANYDPPTGLTASTTYRRLAKDGACNTSWDASTGTWTVTVRPQFIAGAIPITGETICYNGDPALITATTAASGGDNVISYQWQSQGTAFDESIGFTDITAATDANYDPPAGLTTTTTYRRLAMDGTCNTAWSASTGTWTVTVRLQFTSGAINATGETICYNGNPAIIGSTTVASGGDGSIIYQWQSMAAVFDAVSWIDISGASVSTYDPPTGLTSSTVYRRLAKDGTCNTSFTAATGTWTVAVRAQFAAGAIATAGETICYNGDPAVINNSTAASGGDGNIGYQWQKSTTDGSTNFSDIGSATGTSYDPPTGLTATTWYRRLAKDGTCNTSYTASTGVWQTTVRTVFTAGAIPTTGETICYNGDPALITATTAASGGDNVINYQWQSQGVAFETSVGFTDITGATDANYDPPAGLTATTTYRRLAKDGACNTAWNASTGTWTVTVRTQFTAGAIPVTGETICYNGNPALITATTAASGGNNVISYQWQSQGVVFDTPGGFTDITGATDANYDPPTGLTNSTTYRRLAKDGACNTSWDASTGTWTVTVRPQFIAGAIPITGETICYNGNPALITATTAASGGDNVISYQWQSQGVAFDTPVGFTDITGATDANYDPPASLTTTTTYRRLAKDGTCNTAWSASTGTWTVTVRPQFVAGAINTTGETICYNGNPAIIGSATAASGGDGSITYQWQSMAAVFDVVSWSDISGASVSTFDPPTGLTSSTVYRRLAKDGTCNTAWSASTGTWTVTVRNQFTAGAIATAGETICYNGNPAIINNSTAASGGDGVISYQWQKSTTDGSTNFADIGSATGTSYDPPAGLTATTWYRRLAKDGTCNTSYTASTGVWQTMVRPQFAAGAISTTGETICYNGDPALISETTAASGGDNAISYQWQSQGSAFETSVGYSDITGATDASYDPPANLTTTTTYRRLAKDGTCNTSWSESTGTWTVTVRPQFTPGAIPTTGETICYNGNPAQITATTAASGGNNVIYYQWQSQVVDNDVPPTFTDITGATNANYDPPANLTVTTQYRRIAKDGLCNTTYEASTGTWTVTVYDNFVVGSVSADQDICENAAPALLNSVDPTGGNTPYIYQWQSSTTPPIDGTGPPTGFTNISGATSFTYQPGALTQTTYYRLNQGSSSGCGSFYTNIITVTVEPTPVSGAVTKVENVTNICEGTDVSATIAAGSGGNGTDVREYRTKAGGNWSDWTAYVSGDPVTTTGKTDVEVQAYRSATYCSNSTPNTVSWIIDPTTVGGAVTGGTEVCYGSNSTDLTLEDHVGTVQQWQYSTNGTTWSDTAVTSTTFIAEDLVVATWYRAVVKSGTCLVDYSSSTQITIFTDFHISGYVKYENNPKTPLDGLKITLKKDGTPVGSPVITGANGFYDFAGLVNGNYSLEVATAHPSGQWQTWGGVNNTDALIVHNHIVNTTPLATNPPVIRTTASVKLPHPAIDNIDYMAIRQAAKYPGVGFAFFTIPKWVFSGTLTTTALTDITLNCTNVTRDIRGLCAGDVNGTFVPVSGNKSETQQGPSLQLVNHGTLPVAREIVFPIRVETHGSASLRPASIGAITLFLDYDPSLINITDVTMPFKNDEKPYFIADNGVLQIGWMSSDPISVEQNGALLLIHARVNTLNADLGQQSGSTIRFTLDRNPLSELADGLGNVLYDAKLSVADASNNGVAQNWDNGAIATVNIYPNPARELLNVEVILTSDGNVHFDLVNLQGASVMNSNTGPRYAGWYKESLDVSKITPGVYFLKVSAGDSPVVKKVIIGTH